MMRLEINNGLNLALGPTPTERAEHHPATVALLGADHPGVRLQAVVAEGDAVRRGDVLLTDRADARFRLTAPAAGRVRAVHLGPRRRLESLVIDVDAGHPDPAVLKADPVSPANVRAALLDAGLWPALRARPYDRSPGPDDIAAELYVVALDTEPLAPDPLPIIRARADEFREGVSRLASLVETCFVCSASGEVPVPETAGIEPVQVDGPHPAGLPGSLMYAMARQQGRCAPVSPVWYVGYQDVIAIGALFLSGRLDAGRTVTVAGPGLTQGRVVHTVTGVSLGELTGPVPGAARVVSGSVLSGREGGRTTAFLGRYHRQVTVLGAAGAAVPGNSGMLALEAFEQVWPLRLPVLPLLKAVLVEGAETLSALGATHLAAEDLALCSYLCPAGLDYGAALERTLDALRRGG
ncbi:MAG: hypothetical protein AB7I04_01360 [Pseudomonadales bacterium]